MILAAHSAATAPLSRILRLKMVIAPAIRAKLLLHTDFDPQRPKSPVAFGGILPALDDDESPRPALRVMNIGDGQTADSYLLDGPLVAYWLLEKLAPYLPQATPGQLTLFDHEDDKVFRRMVGLMGTHQAYRFVRFTSSTSKDAHLVVCKNPVFGPKTADTHRRLSEILQDVLVMGGLAVVQFRLSHWDRVLNYQQLGANPDHQERFVDDLLPFYPDFDLYPLDPAPPNLPYLKGPAFDSVSLMAPEFSEYVTIAFQWSGEDTFI